MQPPMFVYDFETTGLPNFKAPSGDPCQPHIVQAAAALVDPESRQIIASIDLIVRPDGWEIPDEVAQLHGITTEKALAQGVDEAMVVHALYEMWSNAKTRIAHNEQFDARIMRIAQHRFEWPEQALQAWKGGEAFCTARAATPIMKLPPTQKMVKAGFRHHKTPNLTEAYEHFTGKTMSNAHSAMPDVLACIEVYWALQDAQAEAA